MDYQEIDFEVKNKIAYVKLDSPKTLNSMSKLMKREMADAIARIDDDRDIWGVIITGEGRGFSAGTNINDFPDKVEDARKIADTSQKMFDRLENVTKPVIAAVNGFALGGGFELALACDIVVASEKAKFGFSEVKIGAIPCYGGSQRLLRLVGTHRAKELIFTGRTITAQEAKELTLVSEVVPAGEEVAKAEEIMAEIFKNSPIAVGYAKICINRGAEMPLAYGVQLEQDLVGMLVPTYDMEEGTKAFFEKRPPKFENR